MSYTVVITRKTSPWDTSGPAITQVEWVEYTDRDADMRLDGFVEVTASTGQTMRMTDPGIAIWTAHPGAPSGVPFRLDRRGNVALADPDDVVLRKAWMVAQALGAHLQGEEGETYGPDGHAIDG